MPKVQAERGHIYGEVNSIKDIRELNRTIRQEMDRAKAREQLTELKKRSDYLCTLTFSPAWQKKFGEYKSKYPNESSQIETFEKALRQAAFCAE